MRRGMTGNAHAATTVGDVKVPAQSRTEKTRFSAACKDDWPREAEIHHICLLYVHKRCVTKATYQLRRCLWYR